MRKFINLLPPEEQKQNRLGELVNHLQEFGLWLVVSLLVLSTVLLAAQIFLRAEAELVAEEVRVKAEDLSKLKQDVLQVEFQNFQELLRNFQILRSAHRAWDDEVLELARLLPPEVTLDKFTINQEAASGKVEVAGRAGTREAVLQLRENLLQSEQFRNVNFPLQNLEKANNTSWKYKFYLKS